MFCSLRSPLINIPTFTCSIIAYLIYRKYQPILDFFKIIFSVQRHYIGGLYKYINTIKHKGTYYLSLGINEFISQKFS